MNTGRLIVCLLCALIVTSCESPSGRREAATGLAGTSWKVTHWPDASLDPSGFTITASFDASRISGTSAVNTYGATYSAGSDGSFSVGRLVSTLMACPADAAQAESIYIELLQKARHYGVRDNRLTLQDSGRHELLVFQRQ